MAPRAGSDRAARTSRPGRRGRSRADLVRSSTRCWTEGSPGHHQPVGRHVHVRDQGLLGLEVWNEGRCRHHKGSRWSRRPATTATGSRSGRRPHRTRCQSARSTGKWRGRADSANFGGWVDVVRARARTWSTCFRPGPYAYVETAREDGAGGDRTSTGWRAGAGRHSRRRWSPASSRRGCHTPGRTAGTRLPALIGIARSAAHPGVGAVLLPK